MKRFTLCSILLALSVCIVPAQETAIQSSVNKKLPDLYETQDVNGFMPDRVFIRTMTQTYCKGYNFVVVDGRIYVKKQNDTKWTLFLKKGLPFSKDNKKTHSYFEAPAAIREICTDADSLFAFDEDGVLYHCYINFGTKEKLFTWQKVFGWPKRSPLVQNELVRDKRGWSMGVRRTDILWYTDRFGNEHHYGTMGLETVYFLTKDGQHIRFTDSGLPPDFSHSIQCPLDGTFISENISVSGSTIFLIGNDGSMFTRLIDFDTMGCDPMFFKYTYDYEKQTEKGSDYLSNFTTWALPAEDWQQQPKIPLTGKARLTKAISIAQTGLGNSARELRVAGTDENNRTGYYHKKIDERIWSFTPAPLDLNTTIFLDESKSVIGPKETYTYKGYIAKNGSTLPQYTCTVQDVSLTSEGKCTLTIAGRREHFSCVLYPIEMWTYMARFNPGYDGTSKNYFVTVEYDQKAISTLSPEFRSLLDDIFEKKNHKLFALSAEATSNYYQIECSGKDLRTIKDPLLKANEYVFFMTKDGVQDIHPDVYKGAVVLQQPLIKQAEDSSLLLPARSRFTIRDRTLIQQKIDANRAYKKLLEEELGTYKEYEKDADTSRWGYKAVDLITTITFLNKIDFPKIKTMTSYGGELMNTNARSFAELAGYREWCYSHILELVNLRTQCYSKMIEQFDANELSAMLDQRLCNTFPEYFNLVYLPKSEKGVSGTKKIQAHLDEISFIPYFPGYMLQLSDGSGTTVLVELRNCAEKIFSRTSKKTLQEDPIELPVSFTTVTVLSETKTEKEKEFMDIKNLSDKKGMLVWDGKKVKITVWTSPFTNQVLFDGE